MSQAALLSLYICAICCAPNAMSRGLRAWGAVTCDLRIWAQPWNPLWPGLLTSSVHCAGCGDVHSVSQLSEHGPQELLLYKTFFPKTMFCYFKFAFRFLKVIIQIQPGEGHENPL